MLNSSPKGNQYLPYRCPLERSRWPGGRFAGYERRTPANFCVSGCLGRSVWGTVSGQLYVDMGPLAVINVTRKVRCSDRMQGIDGPGHSPRWFLNVGGGSQGPVLFITWGVIAAICPSSHIGGTGAGCLR